MPLGKEAKQIMNLKIATRQWKDEGGRLRKFHYFLTVDLEETSHFSLENYGVQIVEEGGNCSTYPALTTSASRIDELMTSLVDHQVGPTGLPDIIADWL